MSASPVLVTGAAGFLGAAIVRALSRAGTVVLATDRVPADSYRPRTDASVDLVKYVERDLQRETLDDLAASVGTVVHAAAVTPEDEGKGEAGDALLRVNYAPLPALLRSMRTSASCRRLVFVSSAGVFDHGQDVVLEEEDATGGTTLYGATKLATELVARRYASHYELEAAFVRPTSLFGAGEVSRPSRPRITAFARLVDHARRREAVRVERASSRTDWLSVDDAADAVRLLCDAPALDGRSFNLSAGQARPLSDVVAAVAAVAGLETDDDSAIVVDGGHDRPAVIKNDRIRDAIGWRPARTLEDGVRDLLGFLDELEPAAPAVREER